MALGAGSCCRARLRGTQHRAVTVLHLAQAPYTPLGLASQHKPALFTPALPGRRAQEPAWAPLKVVSANRGGKSGIRSSSAKKALREMLNKY